MNIKDSEKFQEMIENLFQQYQKKYFYGKDVNTAICESCEALIYDITILTIKCEFLNKSLSMIEQETFYKSFSPEKKEDLTTLIKATDDIYNEILDILFQILEGYKKTDD